jgi:hypothetical protein
MSYQQPPLTERIWHSGTYLFTALIGLSIIIWPPANTVESTLGAFLTTVWALFLATALVLVPAHMKGKYLWEYALLPLCTIALFVALAVVWGNTTHDPTLVPRASASSALLCELIRHWLYLHHLIGRSKKANRLEAPWTRH